jgi:hypothetical protein
VAIQRAPSVRVSSLSRRQPAFVAFAEVICAVMPRFRRSVSTSDSWVAFLAVKDVLCLMRRLLYDGASIFT